MRHLLFIIIVPSGLVFLVSVALMIYGAGLGCYEFFTNVDIFRQRGLDGFAVGIMCSVLIGIVFGGSLSWWLDLKPKEPK